MVILPVSGGFVDDAKYLSIPVIISGRSLLSLIVCSLYESVLAQSIWILSSTSLDYLIDMHIYTSYLL